MNQLVEEDRFRLDLYHRIADWQVRLPRLAERHMDIANLAVHFLQAACKKAGIGFGGISRAALDRLKAYHWPGNVRELEREMKRCTLFLNDGGSTPVRSSAGPHFVWPSHKEIIGARHTERCPWNQAERKAIQQALSSHGGNISQTANQLGIGRSTLYRRIQELDIAVE